MFSPLASRADQKPLKTGYSAGTAKQFFSPPGGREYYECNENSLFPLQRLSLSTGSEPIHSISERSSFLLTN
jgi:hypothetical protein